jgi:ribosomal protein S14
MGKDTRGAQRREQDWLAREATQRCQVCGRRFVMRAEKICSRDCLAKLQEGQASTPGVLS